MGGLRRVRCGIDAVLRHRMSPARDIPAMQSWPAYAGAVAAAPKEPSAREGSGMARN